jgi:hypothetical protein
MIGGNTLHTAFLHAFPLFLTSWAVEQNILQLRRKLKLLEDIELNISRVPGERLSIFSTCMGL